MMMQKQSELCGIPCYGIHLSLPLFSYQLVSPYDLAVYFYSFRVPLFIYVCHGSVNVLLDRPILTDWYGLLKFRAIQPLKNVSMPKACHYSPERLGILIHAKVVSELGFNRDCTSFV